MRALTGKPRVGMAMATALLALCLVWPEPPCAAQDNAAGNSSAQPAPGTEREIGGIVFVWCPPGEYMQGPSRTPRELAAAFRGAREEWYADALPRRATRVAGFWMSKTEITRAQWERVMGTAPWADHATEGGGTRVPANYVTWDNAVQFAESFGRMANVRARLPWEAEWEYACRAGTESLYSFGDERVGYDDHMWHWGNTVRVNEAYPHETALKEPNAWGLHDMHGNVSEWCQDVYRPYGRDAEPPPEPGGPEAIRVVRGGSYADWASLHLASYRSGAVSGEAQPEIGFRVVVGP